MIQRIDIAVVGSGIVGLALSAALKHSSLQVAVIEKKKTEGTVDELCDVRVSILNHSSETILKNLGVWWRIAQNCISSYSSMEIWEQDSFASIGFSADALLQNSMGRIVENRVIQVALLEHVKQQSNVFLLTPATCSKMIIGQNEVWITLDNGEMLATKLVIGADGANSWVRDQLEIPLTYWDYGYSTITANVFTQDRHQAIVRQIFTQQGSLAFLPMSDEYTSSIIWSIESGYAEELVCMSESEFNKYLTAEFDNRLGLCQVMGKRLLFPLKMHYSRDFAVNRAVLVGDAAHTMNSLLGQEGNIGLLGAASLAQEILAFWERGEDFGSKRNLRNYERWRKTEAIKVIIMMQGLKYLFDGDNSTKRFVRGMGMRFIDQLPYLKDGFIKRALGLKGNLPNLAKRNFGNNVI
ncbi:protein visC [Candidatus Photodesmus blepharus]|uniref:Protein visC n=1 Tax=Candidatus Photodesmus blepharonis TaxID=1179155 RepID=A0A084CMH6_9GAMM|nr:FAD-dependent monooxygenase [Candidatus Photodesmus blepharus]KEY91005.1 protein visC [Candidatus Photodesmus blepharus]